MLVRSLRWGLCELFPPSSPNFTQLSPTLEDVNAFLFVDVASERIFGAGMAEKGLLGSESSES